MANGIAYIQNFTSILDAVYQRSSVSGVLTSGQRMVRAGRHAREIMIPKIEVSGLGDYTRNARHKTGSMNHVFETKAFNCDCSIYEERGENGDNVKWCPSFFLNPLPYPHATNPTNTRLHAESRRAVRWDAGCCVESR